MATAVVTLLTAAALALCAGVLLYAVHQDLVGAARIAAEEKVTAAAEQLRKGALPASVLPADGTVITKVAPRAVATSIPATKALASPGKTVLPRGNVVKAGAVAKAMSVQVLTPHGTYVLAATPDLKSAETTLRVMTRLLLASIPLVLLLVAVLTWFAMGRALRPVEAIRAEFAEITAHDLHRRVPDPRSGDEVSRLAGTMNLTLDQLQRAMVRLRTFTSDASHELRSPLTTLRTRLELAVARPEEANWPLAGWECLRDAEQLQEIVEDLLLLARLDAGQVLGRERIVLLDLVRGVAGERSAGRALTIVDGSSPTLPADAGPAVVSGSRTALSRLIVNLVDNAVRYSRTSVEVRVTNGPGQVAVEVTDDGPGIPAPDRRRVFDRFTRLDNARSRDQTGGGGSGLGLAIARDIALAHGGTVVAAEPAPGQQGARLVLTLPAGVPG